MSEQTVIFDTRNVLDWRGNGGSHRAVQIAELVQDLGVALRIPEPQPTTRLERHMRGILLKLAMGYPLHFRRRALSNAGHLAKFYSAELSRTSGQRVFLWENVTSTLGAFLAAEAGCPVLAIPQNIDSLERDFSHILYGYRGTRALERELAFLRRCQAVFCISREEQWFLRVQGIEADYLPYHPPRALEKFLLEVRRARGRPLERRFLLLGTADYEPTARSMAEQIRLLGPRCEALDIGLDVAGYGTERLARHPACARIRFHGTVTQEGLSNLLTATSGAILHQQPSVGALTRIPEFLMAGVPVIANVDASRSTWGAEGVVHYDSIEELDGILGAALPSPPQPARPLEAERRFQGTIRKLLGATVG